MDPCLARARVYLDSLASQILQQNLVLGGVEVTVVMAISIGG